jgi:hypothetical protein
MSIAFLFWLLYILWVILGFPWPSPPPPAYRPYGSWLLWAILIFLLGWRVFGFPVHG